MGPRNDWRAGGEAAAWLCWRACLLSIPAHGDSSSANNGCAAVASHYPPSPPWPACPHSPPPFPPSLAHGTLHTAAQPHHTTHFLALHTYLSLSATPAPVHACRACHACAGGAPMSFLVDATDGPMMYIMTVGALPCRMLHFALSYRSYLCLSLPSQGEFLTPDKEADVLLYDATQQVGLRCLLCCFVARRVRGSSFCS